MTYAPVLVQVYTRHKHFVACIESLARCIGAEHTPLYICSDAGRDAAAQSIVDQIRQYCTTIQGFERIEVVAFDRNLGAVRSAQQALDLIFERYDRVIYTEDDNVFAPNFLQYVNSGLDYYKNNERVFSICGYCHPFRMPASYSEDVFTSHLAAAWGQGLWRDKFQSMDLMPPVGDYWSERKQWPKILSISWSELMEYVFANGAQYWDVLMGYRCMMQNRVNIFPRVSLVRNTGNDGSGEHCLSDDKFSSQIIDDGTSEFCFIDNLTPDRRIERRQADAVDFPFVYGLRLRFKRAKRTARKVVRDYVVQRPRLKSFIQRILYRT